MRRLWLAARWTLAVAGTAGTVALFALSVQVRDRPVTVAVFTFLALLCALLVLVVAPWPES